MGQIQIAISSDIETGSLFQESLTDGLSAGETLTGQEPSEWQLQTGHYESQKFALEAIYPRPDGETGSHARHRWAMPGMIYEIPVGVRGGAWPYKYTMTSGPAWLGIVEETLAVSGDKQIVGSGYGVLQGTAPSSGGPWTVTVRVEDQDGATIDLTWQITLDANHFVHVDFVNGNDSTGDGTEGNPYKTAKGVLDAGTHANKTAVVHGTTYTMDWSDGGTDQRFDCGLVAENPSAWINDPSDGIVDIEATTANRFSNIGSAGAFLAGFRINNLAQTASPEPDNVRMIQAQFAVARLTLFKIETDNPHSGALANDNNASIFLPSVSGEHTYIYLCRNKLSNSPSTGNGWSIYDGYSVNTYLIEICESFDNVAFDESIWLKDINKNGTTRACRAWGLAHGMQGADSNDNEVCYCKVDGPRNSTAENLDWNSGFKAVDGDENNYCYRNSCGGAMRNREGSNGVDPDTHAIANVVAGEMEGVWSTDERNTVTGDYTTVVFDSDMNLAGSYRDDFLGTRGAEIA